MVSSPPPPLIVSLPLVPVSTSLPSVPSWVPPTVPWSGSVLPGSVTVGNVIAPMPPRLTDIGAEAAASAADGSGSAAPGAAAASSDGSA